MLEMFEVIIKMTLLLGLFGIAWFDYRTKLIDARWLWIVGVAGLVLLFSQNGVMAVRQIFAGVVPGALLLLFAWISGESVGFGDGWLFVVTGIFLGIVCQNIQVLIGYGAVVGRHDFRQGVGVQGQVAGHTDALQI